MNLRRFGVLVFVLAWIGALTYSVTAGGTSPERLSDEIARTVEANCKAAQTDLARLPQLDERSQPADAATRLDRENTILTRMVNRSLRLRPDEETPAAALNAWLRDWQRLIAARERYADDLRTVGAEASFVSPAYNSIEPIADTMNDWILEQGTRTNHCNTDALQGEIVNGRRKYETPE